MTLVYHTSRDEEVCKAHSKVCASSTSVLGHTKKKIIVFTLFQGHLCIMLQSYLL